MEKEKFDQKEYVKQWTKSNMKAVGASYKTEFVTEFREACEKLGIKQSAVFREAMETVIEKAKKDQSNWALVFSSAYRFVCSRDLVEIKLSLVNIFMNKLIIKVELDFF